MPAGPEPTIATRLPVLCTGGCGTTQRSSTPLYDNRALDRFDRDRIVINVQRAGLFARGRADVSGKLGEIIGRVQYVQRLLPLIFVHHVIPVRDDVIDRTPAMTKRDAAVHAARTLLIELLFLERGINFFEDFQAFARISIRRGRAC